MGEKPGTSESDVFDSELSCSSFASLWRPIKCSFGGLEVPGVGLSPSPARLAVRLLVLIVILGTVSHSTAHGDALERIRHSGRLLYGSDMEGGGPYAYPDPRSPRDVTGFEVELMALLAKDLGATPEFSQGQWDKLLQVLDAGRIDLVCQRLRMDRDASPRLPGDAPVLRLSIAVDGAARQLDPVVGRPQAAEAGRRPLDGRRAGRLGGRHVRGRARRSSRRGCPVRRCDRRHDGRAERPVRRDPAGPARGALLSRPVSGPRAGRPAGVARLLRDLRPEERRTAARRARPGLGPN